MSRPEQGVVVLAGEDRNDREFLRLLLNDICPESVGRVAEIKDAVRLRAANQQLASRVKALHKLAKGVAARKRAPLACLIVCEDYDAVECTAARHAQQRVQAELTRQIGGSHYLLATAELEAWLLLYPDVLDGYQTGWRVPKQRRRIDTGMIHDPKQVLKSEVSSPKRRYRESDAIEILRRVLGTGQLHNPTGRNTSWHHLHTELTNCLHHA
ncbi:hypothetical protein LX16_4405 [Stackebrandtia albiflava]|uniref:DUF4276 family protein n=1 Tax=Stackebrandtia albiflava TaxID=406432 RepID=A0A562URF1_9ACTN|nr:hypothetical protein [Stackebrandtia albiflava]TWJ08184.1 hypothetical protein LX16_4405 [Stackebrandtia albiflava]